MESCIDGLFELCKEQPFDIIRIQSFIENNNMNGEEVTRAAIKLCDYGMYANSDHIIEYTNKPFHDDLRKHEWEQLFILLLDNGLDANLVICDDGINYYNILQSVRQFDDGELSARILRNILSRGFSPNILIDNITFFDEVDGDLITDIDMDLYYHKWQLDNAVRFWLVLVGFGGKIKGKKPPVNMCESYSVQILKEFERFDYDIIYVKDDWEMRIIDRETKSIVATV